MSLVKQYGKAIKKLVFGNTLFPQEFFIGLNEPQEEITVWLHGMGQPIDVTSHHSMACAAPLTLCIAFERKYGVNKHKHASLSLKFCMRDEPKRVLGEISLKWMEQILVNGMELSLFQIRSSSNHCLSKIRLGFHYLLHSYMQLGRHNTPDMKMSFLERRAAMVWFICPRPVVLVSLCDGFLGNIFPMNIMGDLGNGYFAFALKDSRRAAHLVERIGRIAVSSLPMSQASLAYKLAVNHTKDFIDWEELPFATKMSPILNVPVPIFAQRVREMEVVRVSGIGSHNFFVARILSDETIASEPVLSVIHGFYQALRLKIRTAEMPASLEEDYFAKRGF
ncbi:MAG TPA: hypothetical protein VNU92_17470 [Edaphobacter sp.]|nr:hypothetical protein [Edaphobacter sp.]